MSTVLGGLLDLLEDELREFIDAERARLESERDFLLAVLRGRADEVMIEDTATALTTIYTTKALSEYFPVEDDRS